MLDTRLKLFTSLILDFVKINFCVFTGDKSTYGYQIRIKNIFGMFFKKCLIPNGKLNR